MTRRRGLLVALFFLLAIVTLAFVTPSGRDFFLGKHTPVGGTPASTASRPAPSAFITGTTHAKTVLQTQKPQTTNQMLLKLLQSSQALIRGMQPPGGAGGKVVLVTKPAGSGGAGPLLAQGKGKKKTLAWFTNHPPSTSLVMVAEPTGVPTQTGAGPLQPQTLDEPAFAGSPTFTSDDFTRLGPMVNVGGFEQILVQGASHSFGFIPATIGTASLLALAGTGHTTTTNISEAPEPNAGLVIGIGLATLAGFGLFRARRRLVPPVR